MARPCTLFTGQWSDLTFDTIAQKAKSFGYDGLELACWGDDFESSSESRGQRKTEFTPANSSSAMGLKQRFDSANSSIFLALEAAYNLIRETGPSIFDHGELAEDAQKAYGLFWAVGRMRLKSLTGCRCVGGCLCSEEVDDLTSQVLYKLQRHFVSEDRPFQSPGAVLYQICKLTFYDKLRSLKRDPLSGYNNSTLDLSEDRAGFEMDTFSPNQLANVRDFAGEWADRHLDSDQDQYIFRELFIHNGTLISISQSSGLTISTIFRKKQAWEHALNFAYWNSDCNQPSRKNANKDKNDKSE